MGKIRTLIIGVFLLILFSFSHMAIGEKKQEIKRVSNMDIVVVIDDSGSMKKIFSRVMDSIRTNILENFVIDGDNIHFILFSTNTKLLYSKNKVIKKELNESIEPILSELKPKGKYTDFGRVIKFLKDYLETKTSLEKKFVFFLTDGINDPSPDSEYYEFKDRIAENLKSITEPIRIQGYNFLCFGIGLDTDIKMIADMVGGEYIEIGKSFDENEFKSKLSAMTGFIDLSSSADLGKIGQKEKVELKLISNYIMPIEGKITRVVFKEIKRDNELVLKETPNLLQAPVLFSIQPNKKLNLNLELFSIPSLKSGDYTAYLSFELENKLKFSPSALKISFSSGGLWILWILLVLFILVFFKRFFKSIRPIANLEDHLKKKTVKMREKNPRVFQTLSKTSVKIDAAANFLVTSIRFTLIKVIKGLSLFLLFFPLGFVFDKMGKGLLTINKKISDLKEKREIK